MPTQLRRVALGNPADLGGILQVLRTLESVIGRTVTYSAHRLVSADDTIRDSDGLVLVDTTSGDVTLTLPDALKNLDRTWTIKHYAGGNDAILTGTGGQEVEGGVTHAWSTAGLAKTVQAVSPSVGVGAYVIR